MNSVCLIGRLTKNPELRYTQKETAVCNFTLAVDRPLQKEGEEREADFIPVVVWGAKGEAAAKYLAKGRRVGITGRIQTRVWEDDEGAKHYVTEVVSDGWYFADDKYKDKENQPDNTQQLQKAETTAATTKPSEKTKQNDSNLPPWLRQKKEA